MNKNKLKLAINSFLYKLLQYTLVIIIYNIYEKKKYY